MSMSAPKMTRAAANPVPHPPELELVKGGFDQAAFDRLLAKLDSLGVTPQELMFEAMAGAIGSAFEAAEGEPVRSGALLRSAETATGITLRLVQRPEFTPLHKFPLEVREAYHRRGREVQAAGMDAAYGRAAWDETNPMWWHGELSSRQIARLVGITREELSAASKAFAHQARADATQAALSLVTPVEPERGHSPAEFIARAIKSGWERIKEVLLQRSG